MIVPLIIAAVETRPGWGNIHLSCCPGRTDLDHDLGTDIGILSRAKTAAVVTLNDDDELEELGVETLGAAVREAGMDWFHLPISDYCAPDRDWESDWERAGIRVRALLRDGRHVHVHCRAGCGRSGTIAARLLVELGIAEPDDAIRRVRKARPCALERPEQEDHVRSICPVT